MYKIYFTTESCCFIKAENFHVNYEEKIIRFENNKRNIAFFNLANILGFEEIEENE